MSARKRGGVRPTHEWEPLLPLFEWPEQERYEQIRPLVLFDASVVERAAEVGTSASTLYRRLDRFAEEGMESLFDAPAAKRRRLPPAMRRLILDLKAEYPRFNLNEIANVVRAAFGRKPDVRSIERVLEEEPMPLRMVRRYPPYHEAGDVLEARAAVVALRLDGWSAKAIAGYLGVHHATVYRALERWKDGGLEGLGNGQPGRPAGVRKADFAAVEAIRKLAQNPGLGAFRVHAALVQMGFDLSRHLRQDPRPNPRGLRLREAQGRGRIHESDALRRFRAPRDLERRRAPPGHGRRGSCGRQGVLHDGHGQLQ